MNWLSEYFAQRTSPLSVALWAHPPLLLGPDGPVAQAAHYLPYPGVKLVHAAAETIAHGGRTYTLPARYDTVGPLTTYTEGEGPVRDIPGFFRKISIFAPSQFNPDFVIAINDTFMFVPVFAADGAPGFAGLCAAPAAPAEPSCMALPWTFEGYVSI